MRKKLKEQANIRDQFQGTFVRYGTKKNYKGYMEATLLFKDIRDKSGEIVAEHLWFNQTKGFKSLGRLHEGDIITFDARVKAYVKGYVNRREFIDNRRMDFRLSHPTKLQVTRREAVA